MVCVCISVSVVRTRVKRGINRKTLWISSSFRIWFPFKNYTQEQKKMCQQQKIVISKKSTTFTLKKMLKALFKKQKQHEMLFIEFNENFQNEEMCENRINEKLSAYVDDFSSTFTVEEPEEEEEVYVPVRFARTEAGTFFWTTNLSPVVTMSPSSDQDLISPSFCSKQLQFQDRWAQA